MSTSGTCVVQRSIGADLWKGREMDRKRAQGSKSEIKAEEEGGRKGEEESVVVAKERIEGA